MKHDDNVLLAALSTALSQTLEALAFIEVMPLGKDAPPEAKDVQVHPREGVLWVRVPILRPSEGALQMLVAPALGQVLTRMIFGTIEGGVKEDVMLDAVSETANVLTGRFIQELMGEDVVFDLGLPTLGFADSDEMAPLPENPRQTLDYAVEHHLVTVVVAGLEL